MADRIKFRTTHKRLARGRVKIYYYTKPGGTKFFECMGQPMSQPFPTAMVREYKLALQRELDAADQVEGDCARFIRDYLNSPKYQQLARQTQKSYRRFLDMARAKFGTASAAAMEDRQFKGEIIAWQEEQAETSERNADLAVVVFSRALDHAFKRGSLIVNPAAGIEKLYQGNGVKSPWSESEQAKFLAGDCPTDIANAFNLALYTGLRRTDLAQVTWDAWKGDHIEWKTSKGRGKRTVIMPLTEEAKAFLSHLKRLQMDSKLGLQRTILVGGRGRPLQGASLGKKINERATELQIHKTLHQLRNTYATLLVKAKFKSEAIAGILGWRLEDVEELIRVYVHRDVIVASQIEQLRRAKHEGD